MDEVTAVKDLLESVDSSYTFSIRKIGPGFVRTTWSKPVKENPVPNPVVNVHFRVDKNQIKFYFENQKYLYSNFTELNFEKSLDFFCNNKLKAKVGLEKTKPTP
jgi:hypothetical protein